jgi:hypothetical protein
VAAGANNRTSDETPKEGEKEPTSERATNEEHAGEPVGTTRGFLQRNERVLVGAIAGVLAVTLLGPIVSPLPSLPAKIYHGIRHTISYPSLEEQSASNHVRDVRSRSFWVDSPTFLSASLDYIKKGLPGSLAETESGDVAYHSVPAIVNEAFNYNGFPTTIVGRVVRGEVLDVDLPSFGEGAREYELRGPTPGTVVYLDTSAFDVLGPGQIAVATGVVTAKGVVTTQDGKRADAVFVFGFNIQTLSDVEASGSKHPALQELVAQLRRH